MRGFSARLRAAAALVGIAPALMAQTTPEKRVRCETGTEPSEPRYAGLFAVIDGKLSFRSETTRLPVAPSAASIDKSRVARHDFSPVYAISFDAANEPGATSFVDGNTQLKSAPKTIGIDIYAGKSRIFTSTQPYTGLTIGRLEKAFSIDEVGLLRPLTVEMMVDEKMAGRYRFALEPKALKAQSAALRARMRAQFEGTPFNVRLDTGGRSDRTCFQTGACFLTTAAVDVVGLPDDCWELRQLRAFRDRYAARGPAQAKTMAHYYRIAPVVVHRVDARRERARTWLGVYFGSIVPAAIAAQLGWDRLALVIYSRMTQRLIATFVQE